ncbi:M28 family peptidase [Thalassotalea ganghwensis]
MNSLFKITKPAFSVLLLLSLGLSLQPAHASDVEKLIKSLGQDEHIIESLQHLTDHVGGRLTGTPENLKAVEWALEEFRKAGVSAKKEPFTMPKAWYEKSANALITGQNIAFQSRVVSMPFSELKQFNNRPIDIVNLNYGTAADFAQSKSLKDKWLLVTTKVLDDEKGISGLFEEYVDAVGIEQRATDVKAAGIVYISSRVKNLLYRHLPSKGANTKIPLLVIERERGLQIKRLLEQNHALTLTANIDTQHGESYQSANVIGEIKGSQFPEQIILIGAHLDSYDLGTGALDNGANVNLVIDIARKMIANKIVPKRTIRFALFNGEEQGLYGSWGYTKTHIKELDNHILASSIDIGTGKITGFFTNGREEIIETLNKALGPVSNLGPFEMINVPVVGTDNYDFMMQGVANIVPNQADANYASNYHAASDTFDKVDQAQLKKNAQIMAALILGLANMDDIPWQRQTAEQVEALVNTHNLEASMKTFGLFQSWKNKTRGIRR